MIEQLQPQVNALLISANRNRGHYGELGYPVIADPDAEFGGPLAGMLAGLQHMHSEWLITVPVDAPTLPPDYVRRMCEASVDAPLRVAHDGQRLQPVYCLMHWQQDLGALAVSFADAPACFANVNTPAQLGELRP